MLHPDGRLRPNRLHQPHLDKIQMTLRPILLQYPDSAYRHIELRFAQSQYLYLLQWYQGFFGPLKPPLYQCRRPAELQCDSHS